MQPVQRTQSLEEVLIARDVSPRSAARAGPAPPVFTPQPVLQASVGYPTQVAAGANWGSSAVSDYAPRRQLNMEQPAGQPARAFPLISAAPAEGPAAEDGATARGGGSALSSMRQLQGQTAPYESNSGGGGGAGGPALAEQRVGGRAGRESTAARRQGPLLPRIISSESLIMVRFKDVISVPWSTCDCPTHSFGLPGHLGSAMPLPPR